MKPRSITRRWRISVKLSEWRIDSYTDASSIEVYFRGLKNGKIGTAFFRDSKRRGGDTCWSKRLLRTAQ